MLGTTLVTCTAYLLTFLSFPHDSATTSVSTLLVPLQILTDLYFSLYNYRFYLSKPKIATFQAAKAQEVPIIASNIYLALFTALLLGLGDGGFNVSIYAALGKVTSTFVYLFYLVLNYFAHYYI